MAGILIRKIRQTEGGEPFIVLEPRRAGTGPFTDFVPGLRNQVLARNKPGVEC